MNYDSTGQIRDQHFSVMNIDGIAKPDFVYPGFLICPEFNVTHINEKDVICKYVSSRGTKLVDYDVNQLSVRALTATLFGDLHIEQFEPEDTASTDRPTRYYKVSVHPKNHRELPTEPPRNAFTNNLPTEGDIVLARITRISTQRANVEILAVEHAPVPLDSGVGSNGAGVTAPGGGTAGATFSVARASSDLGEPFRGLLRSQDVRATERDKVKMVECYRPGDIIRAQILSLGDGTNYYLTTARNDLGVVFARADGGSGPLMYALDWKTMVVPSTGAIEKRKCAKPFV